MTTLDQSNLEGPIKRISARVNAHAYALMKLIAAHGTSQPDAQQALEDYFTDLSTIQIPGASPEALDLMREEFARIKQGAQYYLERPASGR